jgi:protein-disulfide isomerase
VRSPTLRPRRPPEGLGARCERATSADQPGLASRAGSSYADRIAEDVASADASGVAGTPSFFINGKRYEGAYD